MSVEEVSAAGSAPPAKPATQEQTQTGAMLRYKTGSIDGPGMTAGELLLVLRDVPPETVVAGTWEGILVPLASARLITDSQYVAHPYVELDVDK
jgi:hypothetical protein